MTRKDGPRCPSVSVSVHPLAFDIFLLLVLQISSDRFVTWQDDTNDQSAQSLWAGFIYVIVYIYVGFLGFHSSKFTTGGGLYL